MNVIHVDAREIFNSKGFTTVECQLTLADGSLILASVPSGTSKGSHEAVELRSKTASYDVKQAVYNIQKHIAPLLVGRPPDVAFIDQQMLQLDGTSDKHHLGANAMLAVSIATIRAQAYIEGMALYQLLAHITNSGIKIPVAQFNILSGGVHGANGVSLQEFMIMPKNQTTLRAALTDAAKIFHTLAEVLQKRGYPLCIGHEGTFVVRKCTSFQLLDFLTEVLEKIDSAQQFQIAIDAAATSFYNPKTNMYLFEGQEVSAQHLVDMYQQLVLDYPIVYLEDGLAEDDWQGWQQLTKRLGSSIEIVGDDLFVTNINRLERGITQSIANGLVIKPNQIGTVTETLQTLEYAKNQGYKTIVSHRSAETEDVFIADLAVGAAADQIKAGGCCRSERLAKYNQLLRIEESWLDSE